MGTSLPEFSGRDVIKWLFTCCSLGKNPIIDLDTVPRSLLSGNPYPTTKTRNPKPRTRDPKPEARNPKRETKETLTLKPCTTRPEPPNGEGGDVFS